MAAEAERARLAAAAERQRLRDKQEAGERVARERRDAAAAAALSRRFAELGDLAARVKTLKRQLSEDIAALPPSARARLSGPAVRGLRPLGDWDHPTALAWFDDAFPLSDLYRATFLRLRVDGPVLHSAACASAMGGAASSSAEAPSSGVDFLRGDLGVAPAAHRERILAELTGLLTRSTAHDAAAGSSSGPATPTQAQPATATSECVVCQDAAATHAAVPCGHLCLCGTCMATLGKPPTNQKCPLCRVAMTGSLRVFSPNT